MGKMSLTFGLSALIGLGFGIIIGKRKIDRLTVERDELELQNQCTEAKCEILQRACDNLKSANDLFSNLLMQEKEAVADDYDTWKKETEDILAEEAGQIVDEMSDEEYQETLAYIQSNEPN